MSNLSLKEIDKRNFLQILNDVQGSISCEIGIGGSIAQRLLSETISDLLKHQTLHDVDLIFINGNDSSPERSHLRKVFKVIEYGNKRGWYYGMVHKESGMWVDMFTPAYTQEYALVKIGEREFKASTLENQILYLANDVLYRSKRKIQVRKKWIDKLALLINLPEIKKEKIKKEFDQHYTYFENVLDQKDVSIDVTEFIKKALSVKSAV